MTVQSVQYIRHNHAQESSIGRHQISMSNSGDESLAYAGDTNSELSKAIRRPAMQPDNERHYSQSLCCNIPYLFQYGNHLVGHATHGRLQEWREHIHDGFLATQDGRQHALWADQLTHDGVKPGRLHTDLQTQQRSESTTKMDTCSSIHLILSFI